MATDSNNKIQDNSIEIANPAGSIWHRWEPHIHMPGTLKNDNFHGKNAVEQYVKRLNAANPPIRVVGITDYYVLDCYEKLRDIKQAGGLPNVELIFPNIELRFAVNAAKGSPVNVHLLICPDDPDHIEKTKRFLRGLNFEYDEEDYGCTNEELIRLGRAYNPDAENDAHALKLGVEQSKISPRNLSKAFKESKWARQNIMVAIAASSNDGTAQLQDDGLKALREELQRMSHIIFSGRPGDREFWSGKSNSISIDKLKETYGGPKPCLHGCDAHDFETVGKPDKDRYCWVRGDLTFETLRQICFEPERRVHIGVEPPNGSRPSNTITNITVEGADWLATPKVPINSGLVAIIGERGSGKTALVEMIAAGADSVDSTHTKRSFLERAKKYLRDTTCELAWGSEEKTSSTANIDELADVSDDPRVRYLSQQFVDQLCSSDGLADDLVSEIERVIFEAHVTDTRLGARTFKELREFKTQAVQRRMDKYRETLQEFGNELSVQDDLKRNLEELKRLRVNENVATLRMKEDRKQLTPTNDTKLLDRLEAVRSAAEAKSRIIVLFEKKELNLSALKEEAKQFCDGDAQVQLDQLKSQYTEAGLSDDQWNLFALTYTGDVEELLIAQLKTVNISIAEHKGPAVGEAPESTDKTKALEYFIPDAVMTNLTLSLLLKEQRRLEACIGVDDVRRRRYNELSGKIVRAEATLVQRDEEIKKAEAAPAQITKLLEQRAVTYQGLIKELEKVALLLKGLYQPLQDRLDEQDGTLSKLTFSVNRNVDINAWADAGERLIDKSRSGPFKGIGELTKVIKDELSEVWQTGSAAEITKAMSEFRAKYQKDFWGHAPEDAMKNREAKKNWSDQLSKWLYGTDHVVISYGLEYEGVDIQQLSPGTRGIVLLLLYLSIDVDDDRPLIIDQPEENLDPKSIYMELVERFKEAKSRRQIIIVTHNANLVVNTDADQVIVASRGEHKSEALPDISYMSGGLENSEIRSAVCDILEGGKEAFTERARRLRIAIKI